MTITVLKNTGEVIGDGYLPAAFLARRYASNVIRILKIVSRVPSFLPPFSLDQHI